MEDEAKKSFLESCADAPPRDRRNQRRFVRATLAWAIAFVAASLLIKHEVVPAGPLQWVLAALPIALSVVVLMTFAHFLSQADELQRLIQLQALAVAFGGTYFGIMGYTVLEKMGAPTLEFDDVTIFMMALYILGVLIGWRRFR